MITIDLTAILHKYVLEGDFDKVQACAKITPDNLKGDVVKGLAEVYLGLKDEKLSSEDPTQHLQFQIEQCKKAVELFIDVSPMDELIMDKFVRLIVCS